MPSVRARVASLCLAAGVAACAPEPEEIAPVSLDQVAVDLGTLAAARVYFGHQSVGRDILAGVRALADESGVPLHIEDVTTGAPVPGPGLFHANIGENGVPGRKLDEFLAHISTPAAGAYDVAMLKFCYVDLDDDSRETSPQVLFDNYRKAIADIHTGQPGLAVIHATMPLTADPPGWKTTVKRWLGRSTWTDAANQRRNAYNSLLRAQFPSSETFDIARLEATRADGSISSFEAGGTIVETMAAEHTNDGGHLTDAAGRKVAAAFVHSLAEAVRRRDGAAPQP